MSSAVTERAFIGQLRHLLKPLDKWRLDPATDELCINRPNEVFVRQRGVFVRHEIDFPFEICYAIAKLAGAINEQNVNDETPIVGSEMPDGERIQAIVPPCVQPGTVALSIRIPGARVAPTSDVPKRYKLKKWNKWSDRKLVRHANHAAILDAYDSGNIVRFLDEIVRLRLNPVLCGKTGSGKTSALNTLISSIPLDERIFSIENALEIVMPHLNCVRTVYSHGDQGTSKVTQKDLLAACLRMRPDRIIVGELRDDESSYLYVNEIMTGHEGSPCTVHGRTAGQAANRIANMYRASAAGRSSDKADVISQLGMVIDVIIPFEEDKGEYDLGEIWLAADAERRGETIAELFR